MNIYDIYEWFKGVLTYLGLLNKSGKLMFLGLDNAGKTTLLYMLKEGKMHSHDPTQQPTAEKLTIGKVEFTAYDLGGHIQARKVWRDYFPAVDGIIYIVDASDLSRLNESKIELDGILNDEQVASIPILVLGNKIDIPTAVSDVELQGFLNIQCTGKGTVSVDSLQGQRPVELFMCSVLKRQGFGSGFRWLSQYI